MKIALAHIVEGKDYEAESLNRMLKSASPHVDAIYTTVTHKKGETPDNSVGEVAKLYGANISYFEWQDDFAKARNFNFSQVPKEYDYILWLDSDDVIRFKDAFDLKKLLKDEDLDALSMWYLYWFDENKNPVVVHAKTRVIRNDGTFTWVGEIHEDFDANRRISLKHITEGIDVLHLSDTTRVSRSRERNLRIAEKQKERMGEDPRGYWNVGNALQATQKFEEAIKEFEQFLDKSQSTEEKYIVNVRIAECYRFLHERNKAIEYLERAIGMKPLYPEAYFALGEIYLWEDEYRKAIELFKLGLAKEPPEHKIMTFNPRDYDYNPMKKLAVAYMGLNQPTLALPLLEACAKITPNDENLQTILKSIRKTAKETKKALNFFNKWKNETDKKKLKSAMDKLPEKLKQHPAICNLRNLNFVKEKSSGKDIVYFCGYTREWNPQIAKEKGVGGSEEAVINLTKRWAKEGYNVTVYGNCGKEKVYDGVTYKPFWMWNYRDKQDVVIIWRHPQMAQYDINAGKVFLDLHDVIKDGEFTQKRLAHIDKVFVKSEFHKTLFPSVPEDKFVVVPNGIDADVFKENLERDPKLIINTSSPDRSLSAFIEGFKIIKKTIPDVKAKWAYGWKLFEAFNKENNAGLEWMKEIKKQMAELGIEDMGMISHSKVAKLYLTAGIFGYPCEFAEIDCISLTKAQAGGAYPVTTDFAALKEKMEYGYFVHSDKTKDDWVKPYQFNFSLEDKEKIKEWANAVIDKIKNPQSKEEREEMRQNARDKYSWDKIAKVWYNYFNKVKLYGS